MNGNNKPKEVKQTSNEQPENLIALSKQIACDHGGLKGEHAAIFEIFYKLDNRLQGMVDCINQTTTHILKIETRIKAIEELFNTWAEEQEPEPPLEKVEPAEGIDRPAEKGKPGEKDGSGL